ncbi:triose-phosphate isomerase [Parvularcula oceani]|uniref:triose-phosphate isomerase n=1 Tax=Parvularcula oceani TaxID=1247963 RepID=UPI0004E239D5|nr:triose-phosphate isomerase [Parvularcula oceani]
MKKLIAGNWKMNGLAAAAAEIEALGAKLTEADRAKADVLVCPPATLVSVLEPKARAAGIALGGQDCHEKECGAHTGCISAEMLADAGATYVIVGHSERRADFGETDAAVKAKAEAAQRAGLMPIVCVGETRDEREAGRAEAVVRGQLEGSLPEGEFVVAYEPVWAIGTGLVPEEADIAAMHRLMREVAGPGVRLLYGGSVKPANAKAILGLDDVDGALVGGASLKAEDFYGIISAA